MLIKEIEVFRVLSGQWCPSPGGHLNMKQLQKFSFPLTTQYPRSRTYPSLMQARLHNSLALGLLQIPGGAILLRLPSHMSRAALYPHVRKLARPE